MIKEDVILLMCHEVCEDLHIDKVLRKNFFAYFYSWTFSSYNQVEKIISEIDNDQSFFNRWKSSFKYMNAKFSYEEKKLVFFRLFDIFSTKIRNKKAPHILREAYEYLEIKESDFEYIRDGFYRTQYFNQAGLRDYSNALLFSLMISYSNDGILDQTEFKSLRNVLHHISGHMPKVPIHSFDIKNVLAVNAYSKEEILKMRSEVVEAVKSDGEVNKKEIAAVKSVVKKMHLGEFHDDSWKVVSPFISLIVLLADNELSEKEEEWFLEHYDESFIVNNIEQVFWLFSVLIQVPDVFKKNRSFIRKLWHDQKPLYDMANMLFLTFAKHFLRLDENRLKTFADYIKIGRKKDIVEGIDEILSGKVVEEEILLIINLVLNDRYDLEKINGFLNKKYIERVFKGVKKEDSKLKYLAICHILFADETIDGNEYKALWEAFASSRLNPQILQSVIYDYSICNMKVYKMDDYHEYLNSGKFYRAI
ncbi:hypothetical protein M902_1995 [Bacteriovorax sp. BAL6_X]|uniref:hypothetical protein n=1 Tax=Bacteriovorax sp. BAL6_X TaxID=1201290 RepID=UPI000385DC6F|nr:hypothetical protein [Bacteriovorax sp. BAL6_X]EPZ51691.1 hypothetical protein M902_1995 [Bacteriovorax sp. BAL6_X]